MLEKSLFSHLPQLYIGEILALFVVKHQSFTSWVYNLGPPFIKDTLFWHFLPPPLSPMVLYFTFFTYLIFGPFQTLSSPLAVFVLNWWAHNKLSQRLLSPNNLWRKIEIFLLLCSAWQFVSAFLFARWFRWSEFYQVFKFVVFSKLVRPSLS